MFIKRFLIGIAFTTALSLFYIITSSSISDADEPKSVQVKVEVYNAQGGADILIPYQAHAQNGEVSMAKAGKVLKEVGVYNCVIDGEMKTVQLTFTLCAESQAGPLHWIGSLPIQPWGNKPKSTSLMANFSAFAQLVNSDNQ